MSKIITKLLILVSLIGLYPACKPLESAKLEQLVIDSETRTLFLLLQMENTADSTSSYQLWRQSLDQPRLEYVA